MGRTCSAPPTEAQIFKIDPGSGTVLGTLDFGSGNYLVTARVAGDRIVVVAGHSLLGVITIADWSQRSMPLSFEGIGMRIPPRARPRGGGRHGVSRGAVRLRQRRGAASPRGAGSRHRRGAPVQRFTRRGGRVRAGRERTVAGRRGVPPHRRSSPARPGRTGPDHRAGARLEPRRARRRRASTSASDGTIFVAPSRARSAAAAAGGLPRSRPSPAPGCHGAPRSAMSRCSSRAPFPAPARPFCPTVCCRRATTVACYPSALPSPTAPAVRQAGSQVSFSWTLPGRTAGVDGAARRCRSTRRRERRCQLRTARRCHVARQRRAPRIVFRARAHDRSRRVPACRPPTSRLPWARRSPGPAARSDGGDRGHDDDVAVAGAVDRGPAGLRRRSRNRRAVEVM